MKFLHVFFKSISIIMVVSCIGISCQKESTNRPLRETNYAKAVNKESKTSQNYIIVSDMGHEASSCDGCIIINEKLVHCDCQGYGNACRVSSNVSLYSSGNSAYIVTTDTFGLTNEDFFNMPSRSLFVEYDEKNNEVWLNIPAQLVYRDSSTQQFTFTNLFYSNSAYYTNN